MELFAQFDAIVYFVFQVLYIQAFVFVILMGKLMRKVFFGQLRAAEMEVMSMNSLEGIYISEFHCMFL